MKAVDVFCGAGGMSLGLQSAGFDLLCGIDNDPECAATLALNDRYIQHPVLSCKLEDVDAAVIRDLADGDRISLVAGGPPCQGFSIQRIGPDADSRKALVGLYVDFALQLAPRAILLENVVGLQGSRGRAALAAAIAALEDAGYVVSSAVLDAADYGVPQRRRRLFLVAIAADCGGTFSFPTPMVERRDVRGAIGHLPEPSSAENLDPVHRADRLSDLNKRRLAALAPGQGRDHLPSALIAQCHQRSSATIGHRNVYGRMSWDDVAPTITARFDSFTRGKFGHPTQLRSISLREGALLQGFPSDYSFEGTKVSIARQIGNAVPPPLAAAVAMQIRHELETCAV